MSIPEPPRVEESPWSHMTTEDLEEMLRQQVALGPGSQRPEDQQWAREITDEIARRRGTPN